MYPTSKEQVGETFMTLLNGVIELLSQQQTRISNLEIIVAEQRIELAKLKLQMKEWT